MDYQNLVYERCSRAIADFDESLACDIYVLGLMYGTFWSANSKGVEVAYQGVIWFRYNTQCEFKRSIRDASEEAEAKWNPSFWCDNAQEIAPRSVEYGEEPDNYDFEVRNQWCASEAVMLRRIGDDGRPVYNEAELYRATVLLCQRIIQKLHEDKIVVSKFGRPIPIIIYNDECGAEVQETLASNPKIDGLREMSEWFGA